MLACVTCRRSPHDCGHRQMHPQLAATLAIREHVSERISTSAQMPWCLRRAGIHSSSCSLASCCRYCSKGSPGGRGLRLSSTVHAQSWKRARERDIRSSIAQTQDLCLKIPDAAFVENRSGEKGKAEQAAARLPTKSRSGVTPLSRKPPPTAPRMGLRLWQQKNAALFLHEEP